MIQTRAQKDLILAEAKVRDVSQLSTEVQDIYRPLCQSFPVMVRTCGLCQAIAFSKDKASGDGARAEAHGLLLAHVAAILDVVDPLAAIRDGDTFHYMLHTRRVLSAWIYFKRFAVSILAETGAKRAGPSATNVGVPS